MVRNTLSRRQFADFCFGVPGQESLKLPATIDSVRAMILSSGQSPLELKSLKVLETLTSMRFENLSLEMISKRRLSNEIDASNCKLEIMNRSRLSNKRLSVALLASWFDDWINTIDGQPMTFKVMTEMADVITYCSIELKKCIDKQCQVQGKLFNTLFERLVGLHNRVGKRVDEFLLNIAAHSQAVIREADRKIEEDTVRREKKATREKEEWRQKVDHIAELTRIVRQLNIKLGNHMYVQKLLRSEIRYIEEKNHILIKENNAISEVIKNVIQDLRGTLIFIR